MFNSFFSKTLFITEGPLTLEFINNFSVQLEQVMGGLDLPDRRDVRLRLASETILLNWLDFYTTEQYVTVSLYSLWGKHYVLFRLAGEEHNPLMDSTLYGLPLEYIELITYAKSKNDISPYYSYHAGYNNVKISLPRKHLSATWQMLIAIFAAIVTCEISSFMPLIVGKFLAQEVFPACSNMILGLIKMLSSIFIFTAMVTSICNMESVHNFTRFGRSMLVHIQECNFLAVLLGLCVSVPFFGIAIHDMSLEVHALSSLIKIIAGIVPTNLTDPFTQNNTTQILFMGVVVGCFFLTVQEKVTILFGGIKELHYTIMHLLNIICRFIPFVVYFSVSQLILNGSFSKIGVMADVFILFVCVLLAYVFIRLVYISLRSKVGMIDLFTSLSNSVITGLTSASSMAMMPFIHEKCLTRFKLHENYINFALPLEMIMLKPLSGIFLVVMSMAVCHEYGVEVSFSLLISSWILISIISSAIPPVPGGGIVVLTVVFAHFNFPQEALALPIAVEFLFDMLRTGFHGYIWGAELVLMDKKLHAPTN